MTNDSNLKKITAFIIFCLVSMLSHGQTGQTAIAYPVKNIKVDGDLSDWPSNFISYPIGGQNGEKWGSKPTSEQDVKASFKIGFDSETSTLFVAVTVIDESILIENSENGDFDTHDGNEIYIDQMHGQKGSSVVMQAIYGKKRKYFGRGMTLNSAVCKFKQGDSIRFYEWKIDLNKTVKTGQSIGFDISISDKDKDNSFSWYAWGAGTAKQISYNRLGDVILLNKNTSLGKISGNVIWSRSQNSKLPTHVRIESVKNSKLWIQATINKDGYFHAQLPKGKYYIYPSSTMQLRLDESTPIKVCIKANKNVVSDTLKILRLDSPKGLIGNVGVLRRDGNLNISELENFVETYMKYYSIPGLSLAIIKDSKIIYSGGFGKRIAGEQSIVTDSTLFEAASLTKPMFSYTVNRLVDRGILELDKPLYQYLPFPEIESDERYKLITTRIVLSHQTGFPNWRSENTDRKMNIKFTPGTQYGYSGEGFEYLARVVEHITGKNVSELIQEEVFNQFDINNATLFWKRTDDEELIAIPHRDGSTPLPKRIWNNPVVASSLHINAKNYAKFLIKLVNGEGLTKERFNDMFTIHTAQPKGASDSPVGLGIFVMQSEYGTSYGHGGANSGFTSNSIIYQGGKMGYVFLVNNEQAYPFDKVLKQYLITGNESN